MSYIVTTSHPDGDFAYRIVQTVEEGKNSIINNILDEDIRDMYPKWFDDNGNCVADWYPEFKERLDNYNVDLLNSEGCNFQYVNCFCYDDSNYAIIPLNVDNNNLLKSINKLKDDELSFGSFGK